MNRNWMKSDLFRYGFGMPKHVEKSGNNSTKKIEIIRKLRAIKFQILVLRVAGHSLGTVAPVISRTILWETREQYEIPIPADKFRPFFRDNR